MEGLYYLCSENKGTDPLRGYREADFRLSSYAKSRFSNDAAHMFKTDCDFKMSEISNIACRWVKTMPEPLKPRPLHVHGSFVFSVCKL